MLPINLGLPIDLGGATLRAFEPGDFAGFHAYWSLPEVARYVRWDPADHDEELAAFGRRLRSRHLGKPGDNATLAIVESATDRTVGEVMLNWADGEHRQGEVGFALHPDAQGRGLAKRAASEMLRIGFDEAHLHRISGICDARNDTSAGLLARLGLRREGHFRGDEYLKGEWTDTFVFAMLASEWRDRRQTNQENR
jgi:RimJ/RimL family protein N-acetyltransferase